MPTHIGSQIARGELSNKHKNSVTGWIDFGGDWGVHMQLTGNFTGELAGQHLRFTATRPTTNDDCPHETLDGLADMQIGIIGAVHVRRTENGGTSLCLEWFSQNGQIVAEMHEPTIELNPVVEMEHAQDDESGAADLPGFDFEESEEGEDSAADPYQLFAPDLEAQLQQSTSDHLPFHTEEEHAADPDPNQPRQKRPWDEVIPGLDPETKKLYDQWDEITEGTKDEPITSLFDPPLTLKRPDDVADEAEAAAALHTLLARLAQHCVAIHICEHFTALDTYRWLLDDLLPETGIHPNLGPTGFVAHYDTSEDCAKCDAEFEERWKERQGE
jgi:hypothetical protein